MASTILGFIGVLIASIFFGSNYVPVKKYPTGDGMTFVYVFSGGVMVVGLVAMIINGEAIFVPSGILGGTIWAVGNLCVVPIIKTIGLGLGPLVWGGACIIAGFAVGKFGLFGVNKDVVSINWMNWTGFVIILGSMIVFFFIKPELSKQKDEIESGETERLHINSTRYDADGADEDHKKVHKIKFEDRLSPKVKVIIGFALSIFSGVLYGVNMVPMKLWVQAQSEPPKPLAFVFSHFMGIYLASTVFFFVYCLAKKNTPQVFGVTMLPSFISGAMWGIAQCGLMVGTQILGFTVAVPIGSAGPALVNALWGVVVFREIRGRRNLGLLTVSLLLSITGIALVSESH